MSDSEDWLDAYAMPVALAVAAVVELWALMEVGPLPAALLSGPVAGVLAMALVFGISCGLNGQNIITCPLMKMFTLVEGVLVKMVGDVVKQLGHGIL